MIEEQNSNDTWNEGVEMRSHELSRNAYPPSALYKAYCIDFYIKKYKCQLITSEFRYGISKLITDLVIITQRNTISIEIKTEKDDLRRLKSQIIEARKNFNLTIVFAASQYKHELLNELPDDVGITLLKNGHCEVLRIPKRNVPSDLEILASIPVVYLRSFFSIPNNLDSDKARSYVIRMYHKRVQECFRAFMNYRFAKNYNQFLSDRGEKTHIDDIPILTMKSLIEIK